MSPPRSQHLRTARLLLRPTEASDAVRALEIQSNWNVTRNLRMAMFPPDRDATAAWFASHKDEWHAGTAFRFAILHDGRMIGVIDLDEIAEQVGDIGYWLDQPSWGQGLAFEAAREIARFAFEDVRLSGLRSGHAADNPASGRILVRLGFRHTEDVAIPSLARGGDIAQRRYCLSPSDWAHQTAA